MNYLTMRHAVPLLVLSLSLFTAQAEADMGKYRYGCEVTTIHDRQGFVTAMADSLQEAVAMAGRAKLIATRLGTQEPAKQVVQCVLWPKEKFTDASFQTWVDEVLPK